jgi:endonuclease/exonuclease/phosphatase (EEP) superfamily protein YafD
MKKWIAFLWKNAEPLLVGGLVFASLIGYCGAYFSVFDHFAHFRVQYCVLAVVLLFWLIYLKHWLYAIIMLCVALFNGWLVKDWVWVQQQPASTKSDFRVFHANVLFKNEDYERVIAQIREENPDFYSLNETLPASIQYFQQHLPQYPYTYHVHAKNQTKVLFGSKQPFKIDSAASFKVSGLIVADMTLAGRKTKVILCHAYNPIRFSDFDIRNQQLAYVQQFVRKSILPVVMVGDLNITPWSVFYQQFEQKSQLHNTRKGFGWNATWPFYMLPMRIPIDHCLISRELEVINFRTGHANGSDHLPLVIDLKYKKPL